MESYLSMIFFGDGEDKARKREAEGLTRPSEPNSRCRSYARHGRFVSQFFFSGRKKTERTDGTDAE